MGYAAKYQALKIAPSATPHHDQVNRVCFCIIENSLGRAPAWDSGFDVFHALGSYPRFRTFENFLADRQ